MKVFAGQVRALAWKNFILLKRTRWLTLGELLAPVIVMLVFGILDAMLKYSPPSATQEPFLSLTSATPTPLECLVFDNEGGKYGYRKPIPGAWCVPILFVPSTAPDVVSLMTTVATRNGFNAPTLFADGADADLTAADAYPDACGADGSPLGTGCVLGFETTEKMKEWAKSNPGRAGAAVLFGDSREVEDAQGNPFIEEVVTTTLPSKHLKYEIWYNATALRYQMYSEAGIDRLGAYAESQTSAADTRLKDTSFMLIVQRMVDESILAWRAEQAGKAAADVSFDVGLTPFPRMRDPKQENIGSRIGPIFINLAFTVPAMILIIRVVREKERHVTGAMRSTGLLDSAYWISYWLQGIFIAIVVTLLAYLAGLAFGLQVFTKADGSVVYTFLFMYELAWFAIAFAIASCFHSVQSAVIASVFFLLVTLLFSAFSFFPVANYIWWEKGLPSWITGLCSTFFPWFNVIKFLADATEVTNTQAALNLTTGLNDVTEGSNFGWNEMYNYTVNRTAFLTYDQIDDPLDKSWFISPVPGESFNFLFFNLAIYFLWAWYLSQVLTGGESRPQPLYFPFYPRYWLTFKDGGSGVRHLKAHLRRVTEDRVAGLDSDVADEMRAVHMESLPVDTTVTLHGLVKRYNPNLSLPGSSKCQMGKTFTAVKGVSYSMQKGKLFALLGHNGAGKTTTIKMVTAQDNPSEGDTLIHGLSVATEAHKIRTRPPPPRPAAACLT